MSMNWKGALAAGAVLGAGVLAACSDAATAPSSRAAFVPKASFAVGDPTTVAPPLATELRVCKAGDVGGIINLTVLSAGQGGTGTPTLIADEDAGTAGTQFALAPNADGSPNCVMAAIDLGEADDEMGDFFGVTETVDDGVTSEMTCYINDNNTTPEVDCSSFFVNTAHGWTVVFTNTAPPPPDVCTYTKGWYQNKNGAPTIVETFDGRTPDQQRAIFAATPGKPNGVTWEGGNNTLNLYQQLLAAINNLDGLTGGPAAVDQAIADALAATGGSGLNITLVAGTDVSALINILSAFNEGQYPGYPHCGDEILPPS